MEPVLEHTRRFWRGALNLESVRLADSRMARITGRAFVVHDTIHWPGPPPAPTDEPAMATLVHELAHCWQHQTGRRQLTRGIIEQTLYTIFGWWLVALGLRPLYDPYDYGGPAGLARAAALDAFPLEAQARIIEHFWLATERGVDTIAGEPVRDAEGRPTAFVLDLERLCREVWDERCG